MKEKATKIEGSIKMPKLVLKRDTKAKTKPKKGATDGKRK